MKCPKCGYHSFEHLDSCKKCNNDLTEHKAKFNLRGFFSPGKSAVSAPLATNIEESEDTEQPQDDSIDFGFDFLEEDDDAVEKSADKISLDDDSQSFNIDQPFGVDSESVPADEFDFDDEDDSDDKPKKGPEFAF